MSYKKNPLLAIFFILILAIGLSGAMNWMVKTIGALDRKRFENAQKEER